MSNPSPSKCMEKGCKAPPEHECLWAGARARSWYCGKHYEPWKKQQGDWLELAKERKVKSGVVGKKYGEEPKKASASRVLEAFKKKAVPEKYKHINFKPPESVANQAEKGLEYRKKSGKGGITNEEAGKQGIGSGVQRAVNLKNRTNVSPKVIKQMVAFFSRHEKNKSIAEENKSTPWEDAGYVAWLLWGGDSGRSWAEKVLRQMEAADEKEKQKKAALVGTDTATVWAISPEQLQSIMAESDLPSKDWDEWVQGLEEVENQIRQHGGAVFHTGGDGAWEATLQDDSGSVVEGEGFLPPYGVKTAAVTGDGSSAGLFIRLPEALGAQYPKKAKDPSPAHVTFLYLGEVEKKDETKVLEALASAFQSVEGPVEAVIGEPDRFMNQGGKVVFSRVRFSKDLSRVRDAIREDLESQGITVEDSFPRWNPQITIEYMDFGDVWKGTPPSGRWSFDSIEVWGLSKMHTIHFGKKEGIPGPSRLSPEIGQRRMARLMAKRAQMALQRKNW